MKPRRILYSAAEREWIKSNSRRPRKDMHADFVQKFGREDVSIHNIKSLCTREGWVTRTPRPKIVLTPAELNWIKTHRKNPRAQTLKSLHAKFGRTDIDVKNLQSIYTRKGWLRRQNAHRGWISYSEEELAWIKSHASMPRNAIFELFVETFKRTDVRQDDIKSLCTRRKWRAASDGRFKKGTIPPNKGKKKVTLHPNTLRAQFKAGHQPANSKPLGYERICSKNGYILIKVAQTNPYTGAPTRIMPKHRYLWEQENGPIPAGCVLRCLDNNKLNTDPNNWICISLSLNARLNIAGYNEAPASLRPSILTTQMLKDKVGEHRPSPMQIIAAKEGFKRPSRRAKPADNLRDLIEETVFDFNPSHYAQKIDQAIAAAWHGGANLSDWAVPLPFLKNDETPTTIHIDWRRLRRRPDLRNRLKQLIEATL
ncbi:HNH endonuclease [Litorimonas taeanensis]|uniref:HNH endonuclease n=1 Tax=Litorimonas taeanensis TaxID=568099 RepID=A0A420WDC0_9PROT|nr:HNH endonuclease signature motif containing protein [Litorimonas taeanensis]RKQ68983.1 HNH endonuclease [Litorimonas taeanensis]